MQGTEIIRVGSRQEVTPDFETLVKTEKLETNKPNIEFAYRVLLVP